MPKIVCVSFPFLHMRYYLIKLWLTAVVHFFLHSVMVCLGHAITVPFVPVSNSPILPPTAGTPFAENSVAWTIRYFTNCFRVYRKRIALTTATTATPSLSVFTVPSTICSLCQRLLLAATGLTSCLLRIWHTTPLPRLRDRKCFTSSCTHLLSTLLPSKAVQAALVRAVHLTHERTGSNFLLGVRCPEGTTAFFLDRIGATDIFHCDPDGLYPIGVETLVHRRLTFTIGASRPDHRAGRIYGVASATTAVWWGRNHLLIVRKTRYTKDRTTHNLTISVPGYGELLGSRVAGEVSHELHQKTNIFPGLGLVVHQVFNGALVASLEHLHLIPTTKLQNAKNIKKSKSCDNSSDRAEIVKTITPSLINMYVDKVTPAVINGNPCAPRSKRSTQRMAVQFHTVHSA